MDVDTDGARVLASVGGVLHLVDLTAGTVVKSKDDLGFLVEWFARSPADGTVTVGGFDCISKCSGSVNRVLSDNKRVATIDPVTLEVRSGPTKADAFEPQFLPRRSPHVRHRWEVVSLTATEGGDRSGRSA